MVLRKTKSRKRTKHTMDANEIMREMGRRGGKARSANMTPEDRIKSAREAGKASVKARKERKREKELEEKRQTKNNNKERG
jgi:hypothetical protein